MIHTRTTPTTIDPARTMVLRASELSPIAIGLDGHRSHPVAGLSLTSAAARFERIAALPPTTTSHTSLRLSVPSGYARMSAAKETSARFPSTKPITQTHGLSASVSAAMNHR